METLPLELSCEILRFLPIRDLVDLQGVSRTMKERVISCITELGPGQLVEVQDLAFFPLLTRSRSPIVIPEDQDPVLRPGFPLHSWAREAGNLDLSIQRASTQLRGSLELRIPRLAPTLYRMMRVRSLLYPESSVSFLRYEEDNIIRDWVSWDGSRLTLVLLSNFELEEDSVWDLVSSLQSRIQILQWATGKEIAFQKFEVRPFPELANLRFPQLRTLILPANTNFIPDLSSDSFSRIRTIGVSNFLNVEPLDPMFLLNPLLDVYQEIPQNEVQELRMGIPLFVAQSVLEIFPRVRHLTLILITPEDYTGPFQETAREMEPEEVVNLRARYPEVSFTVYSRE